MKRKSLLVLTSLLVVGTHAYATEQNWHLIKHREWTTGNIKSISKTTYATENPLLKINAPPAEENRVFALVTKLLDTTDIEPIGKASSINGMSQLIISNHTQSTQSYIIDHDLCVFSLPNYEFKTCNSYEDVIAIDGNNSYNNLATPSSVITFPSTGNYVIDLATTIRNSNDNELRVVSEDYRNITVKSQ